MTVIFPVPVANNSAIGIIGYSLGILLATLVYSSKKPSYQMKVQKHPSSFRNICDVSIRNRGGYPSHEKTTHHNIDCLKKKGYFLKTNSFYRYSDWNDVVNVYEDDIEKLLADCKECNVHTEIAFEYTNMFGNEVQDSQKLYWHKKYQKELT